jgi:hypothetical protein
VAKVRLREESVGSEKSRKKTFERAWCTIWQDHAVGGSVCKPCADLIDERFGVLLL